MALRFHRLALPALVAAFLAAAPATSAPPGIDAAGVALHAGNASNAIALATQALADPALTPRDRARVLVDRGLAHEMLGEHDAATVDLTEAINAHALANADQARAFYNRGVSLDALGQTDDAVGDYSAAIRLDPRHAAALNNRGNAYRRLGRLDDASADYKRSLAAGNSSPEYPDYGLGQIAETQNNLALARNYYQAALVANPEFNLAAERLSAVNRALLNPSAKPPAPPPPPPPMPAAGAIASAGEPAPPAGQSPGDSPVVLHNPATPPTADPSTDPVHLHLPSHPPRPAAPERTASVRPAPDLKPTVGDSTHAQTIQLGAWRNEADAADAWNRIASLAGNLVSGLSPQVVPVEIPHKGRYYRLRAGPVYDDVSRLCAALHARKLECFPVRD